MKTSLLSRSVIGLTLGLSCIAAQAATSQDFSSSTNLTFTSDYMFRGVSQTSGTAAVQGGMSVSHKSGLYASVWGSNVAFANSLELDPSIGFSYSLGDVTYDVGMVHYGYPGSAATANYPFTEGYASVAFKGAKLGVAFAHDYYGHTGEELYTYLSYGTEIKGVSLSASVGQSKFDELTFGPDKSDSYVDYNLTVGKSLAGLNFALSVVGSDMDKDECVAFSGDANNCSSRAIASVSKSL